MKTADKDVLIQTSALIAENLDNQDMISGCVNIRYGGDYEREEKAKEDMYFTYVEIAYITLRSLKPLLSRMSAQSWKRLLMKAINNIGIKIGFVYQDNDESAFEEEANIVHSFLTKKSRKPKTSKEYLAEFENLVNQLVEHAVYPMTDKVYKELLEDRELDFPQEYFVRLKEIRKDNFNAYGNDCEYELEVFDANKKKVGEAMAPVVQMGVDYSSAYEFIYDYDMSDEDDRQSLAEILGVESIPDEWLNEDGNIDTDKLPQEVCATIEEREDEMLIDWYYEDFGEDSDEDGFILLAKFAEKYQVRSSYGSLDSYGKIMKLDITKPLSEMFETKGIKGWFYEQG